MKSLQRGNGGKKELSPWLWEDDPFAALHRRMDRFFEAFRREPFALAQAEGFAPKLDAVEDDKEVRLTAELPGMEEKDVEVVLGKEAVTIKGEKKAEREEKTKDHAITERSYGSFRRVVGLPSTVDAEKAKATFKNGVLTVTIPKKPEAAAAEKKLNIQKE